MQPYHVDLPDFQGPLDLLLSLIQEQSLDITKIALAQVTQQYLAHLETLRQFNPTDLTDFLVIAARLMLIKSEMLLPKPPPSLIQPTDEEDVGEALAQQLRVYKQFKDAAASLRAFEQQGRQMFVRTAPPPPIPSKAPPETLSISLDGLLQAARRALAVSPPDPNVDEVITRYTVTIGQQMAFIHDRLSATPPETPLSFASLIQPTHGRVDLIVTLLALLELIKRRVIMVEQPTLFGDLLIHPTDTPSRLTDADWADLRAQVELS